MADLQITCIIKPHAQSPHEHITHVSGPALRRLWTREEVISSIDSKTHSFFVQDPRTGKRATVGVVRIAGRLPFIRTYADGQWNDNLLSLNQCPV